MFRLGMVVVSDVDDHSFGCGLGFGEDGLCFVEEGFFGVVSGGVVADDESACLCFFGHGCGVVCRGVAGLVGSCFVFEGESGFVVENVQVFEELDVSGAGLCVGAVGVGSWWVWWEDELFVLVGFSVGGGPSCALFDGVDGVERYL